MLRRHVAACSTRAASYTRFAQGPVKSVKSGECWLLCFIVRHSALWQLCYAYSWRYGYMFDLFSVCWSLRLAVWHWACALVSGERRPLAGKCGGRAPASLQAGGWSHGFGRPAAQTASVRLQSEGAAVGTREGLRAGMFCKECPMFCQDTVSNLNGEVAQLLILLMRATSQNGSCRVIWCRCVASFKRAVVRIGRIYVSFAPELNSRDEFVVSFVCSTSRFRLDLRSMLLSPALIQLRASFE